MSFLARLARTAYQVVLQSVEVVLHNMRLGILSLALAVVVWFLVIDVENEEKTDYFAGVIPVEVVNVPQGLAVARLSDPSVSIRMTADKDVWDGITVNDFQALIDLSGVKQRETTLPVRVRSFRGDVKVASIEPSRVTVNMESVTTRTVPVEVKIVGAPPLGYSLIERAVAPETVEVSGPESLVNLVRAAVADVNLTNVRVSMEHEFLLAVRDDQGSDIVGVTPDPNTARVTLVMHKEEFSAVYVVNPSISGNVAPDYEVTDIEVEPAFVSVSATVEILQSIEVLTTENVAVDGAQSDVVRSVKLRLPEGARATAGDEVVVRVRVAPARGEMTFNVPLQVDGEQEGVSVILSPASVSITVEGEEAYLKTLTPDRFGATIDVSDLEPGAHQMPPALQLPPDVELQKADPPQVSVTVSRQ